MGNTKAIRSLKFNFNSVYNIDIEMYCVVADLKKDLSGRHMILAPYNDYGKTYTPIKNYTLVAQKEEVLLIKGVVRPRRIDENQMEPIFTGTILQRLGIYRDVKDRLSI